MVRLIRPVITPKVRLVRGEDSSHHIFFSAADIEELLGIAKIIDEFVQTYGFGHICLLPEYGGLEELTKQFAKFLPEYATGKRHFNILAREEDGGQYLPLSYYIKLVERLKVFPHFSTKAQQKLGLDVILDSTNLCSGFANWPSVMVNLIAIDPYAIAGMITMKTADSSRTPPDELKGHVYTLAKAIKEKSTGPALSPGIPDSFASYVNALRNANLILREYGPLLKADELTIGTGFFK